MPLLVPAASSTRVSAGVSTRYPSGRSMSSWTTVLLNSTRPTSRAAIRTAGRTRGVPNPGDSDCALV